MSGHHDSTDTERTRAHLNASAAFQSPFANPILLVDPDVDLGRGLLSQLTRHGFCVDLAITVEAAPQSWIIALATNTDFEACQIVLSLGADACLAKPFQFSDLLLRLESLSHLRRTV